MLIKNRGTELEDWQIEALEEVLREVRATKPTDHMLE
jgi:hypothetical protein